MQFKVFTTLTPFLHKEILLSHIPVSFLVPHPHPLSLRKQQTAPRGIWIAISIRITDDEDKKRAKLSKSTSRSNSCLKTSDGCFSWASSQHF